MILISWWGWRYNDLESTLKFDTKQSREPVELFTYKTERRIKHSYRIKDEFPGRADYRIERRESKRKSRKRGREGEREKEMKK